ncbi:MAG: DUF4838 domain-containing protein [Planctomycetota bacterium]
MKKYAFLAVLIGGLLLFAVSAVSAAGDLALVKEGADPAPIVVFEDAPPITRRAADELAEYIEKISGARPKVIEGKPDPLPETAIWFGYQPVLKTLFPKLDFDFQHPEEILIAANERHLVIAGRDRWDPDNLVVEGRRETIHGKQEEYGTVNAMYTFLQKHLHVRWLWPGELGEDVLKQPTIALAPFQYRYHPQIRGRRTVIRFSQLGDGGYGRSHDWVRRQRLQLDSLTFTGGHAFTDWWDRFGEERPELFALQPDGTRGGWPNPRTVKICQSNPAVWKQWLADVEEKLKQDPNLTIFSAAPNDGWYSGHCICENCTAWDHPDGELRMFHWQDHREERPALTDRHLTFANRLAELLKERYPDKDYYVLMNSYGHSRPAPVKARPAENVVISSVANFFGRTNLADRGSSRGTTHREQFLAWGKIAPQLIWRPNTGSPAGWQQGLPDLSIAQTIEDLKLVAESGCLGIFIDTVWEHWATQGPQYYVMAHLVWNADSEGQALLDDYYRRGFGPAAKEVQAYYEMLEEVRMAFVDEHGYGAGLFYFPLLYTDELLDDARQRLEQAASKVENEDPIYGRRVAFVQAGLDHTRLVVENCRLMAAYWKEKDESIAEKVRANWKRIQGIAEQYPYAVNWGPLRPHTPRMSLLNPDSPDPRRRPSIPKDLDLE